MARLVNCVKLNKEADGLDFPPIPGEMGKKIWENVSKELKVCLVKSHKSLPLKN